MGPALLMNVHSRTIRRNTGLLEKVEATFGERGPFVTSRSPNELPTLMADLYRYKPSVLFVYGGDGTLRQTLTHLIATYGKNPLPLIAILRGGTMNTVATSIGIVDPPLRHLRHLVERIDRGIPLKTVQRNLLEVNHHYGFIFAIGGFARFIEYYVENKDPTPWYGFKLLTQTTLSALAGGPLSKAIFKEFTVNLWRDSQPLLQQAGVTNIAAASIRHIGFNFKPFWGAEEPGGGFGLLVFRKIPTRLLFHLPRFYLGKPVSDPSFLQLPAHDALIHVEHAMRPMLDGDLLNASKEFSIRSGPTLEWVVG